MKDHSILSIDLFDEMDSMNFLTKLDYHLYISKYYEYGSEFEDYDGVDGDIGAVQLRHIYRIWFSRVGQLLQSGKSDRDKGS